MSDIGALAVAASSLLASVANASFYTEPATDYTVAQSPSLFSVQLDFQRIRGLSYALFRPKKKIAYFQIFDLKSNIWPKSSKSKSNTKIINQKIYIKACINEHNITLKLMVSYTVQTKHIIQQQHKAYNGKNNDSSTKCRQNTRACTHSPGGETTASLCYPNQAGLAVTTGSVQQHE